MADAASIHREYFDAIKATDWDRVRAVLADDFTITEADGVEVEGPEAALEVARTYTTAFPDMEFEVRHQHTPSDTVSILELTVRGTHEGPLEDIPATGKRIEMLLCNVVEVRDGKIVREREYYDTLAMLRQLGVAE